ncbi:LacI family DNA-binding transcriptional regulator [Compostibacter hankyongensis]|uniref:LacI family DNA-binding transcriptional regulator n=1 Tax=Compostibacter hankyongensis TaxID=1007089 RepID=A0ABP8G2A3_9BACT
MDKKTKKRNYTSKEVAEMAGVSQSTVSRVFAGGANVSEKKRKKILEVADRLNYMPNAHARSLITRKSMMIGIVMRNMRNPFYSEVLEIFHNRLSALGYHLIFINSNNEEIQESEITQLLEYSVDGVIITDALLSSPASDRLKRYGIAVVLFNRYTEHLASSAVFCDNYLAAKQIAAYLVDIGHRSFAFISGPSDTSTTIDRLRGFREVLDKRRIGKFVIEPGSYTYESGFRSAQELLTKNTGIDCIFCGNDIIALGVMDALRVIGFKIPKDISVIGFDNIRMGAWASYSLTTWEQPVEDMVDATVKVLLREIKDKTLPPQVITMKGRLIVRNSVRPAIQDVKPRTRGRQTGKK